MPPEKDERAALVDMLGFVHEIRSFVQGRSRQDLDIIAHEYGRVDLDLVWRTAQREMPPVAEALELVVASLPPPQ